MERKLALENTLRPLSSNINADPNTHDAFNLLPTEETVASAMAYPGSTDEVQAVVKWANDYGIPIYPISMGRNCRFLVLTSPFC